MPKKTSPECIADAFRLYLKFNGERFDLIEKEMRELGWVNFSRQRIRKRVANEYIGWEIDFGWKSALEQYLSAKGKDFLSTAEKVYHEVETIRKKLFDQIQSSGVNNRDLIYQHDKYSQRSAELLEQIEKAKRDNLNFPEFLNFLISISLSISPALARELVNNEDAIIRRAKDEFSYKK